MSSDNGLNAKRIGFFLGPIVFLIMLLLPVPEGMKPAAMKVAASTAWMAIWWITEAVPIPATALLPIVLYTFLGVMDSKKVTAPYANRLIYLFMGGFFIAVAMEKWNLHKRIALSIIKAVGASPNRMILGFMIATAFLSMWVSNTATTMMMVPIGLAVIKQFTGFTGDDLVAACPTDTSDGAMNFGRSLMLGIAYAASIGGVATLIGTPPNGVLASQVEKLYGQSISFVDWMAFGLPLSIIFLAISWYLLTQVLFKTKRDTLGEGGQSIIDKELAALGPMKYAEKVILWVFILIALCWISRGLLGKYTDIKSLIPHYGYIHDSSIAIMGALLLFFIPVDLKKSEFVLDWKTAVKIPWDVIILFGGGLVIAGGFKSTGLAAWIASNLAAMQGLPMWMFIGAVVFMTIFLTEITSNTATATLLVPIMGATAVAMSIHPYGPIVGACVAASFAFMLPVATPPNAVVFGSGCVTIPQMCRAGIWLNIIGMFLITLFIVAVLPMIWGIDLSVLPEWAVGK